MFVRKDLSPAQITVQSCHAFGDACRKFLKEDDVHPHLVVLVLKNENKLREIENRLKEAGIKYTAFLEDDMDNQMTAIATEPVSGETRNFFSKYMLLK